MGDILAKIANVIAPQGAGQPSMLGVTDVLGGNKVGAGPEMGQQANVTDLIRQQSDQTPLGTPTPPNPIDRWLPVMGALAGGFATPSAGGAGPIIGNTLGGYVGGRQAQIAAQAAAQKAAQDRAVKVQAIQAKQEATRAQQEMTGEFHKASLGLQSRRVDQGDERNKILKDKTPRVDHFEEAKSDQAAVAATNRVQAAYNAKLKVYDPSLDTTDPETGAKRTMTPVEYLNSKEGMALWKNIYFKNGGSATYLERRPPVDDNPPVDYGKPPPSSAAAGANPAWDPGGLGLSPPK